MKPIQTKKQIKQLAREFDLKYNLKWFDYLWITKRDEIILQYIGNCRDNIYDRYGDYPNGRIKNISLFFNVDLDNLSHRYGGEVYSKRHLKYQKKFMLGIKDKKIKSEIKKLLIKITKKTRKIKNNDIALITKTNDKIEYQKVVNFILKHEWIHILLFKNKIAFNRINRKYWFYDEGLCTYLESYISKTENMLEARYKNSKYHYEKNYYKHAILFKKLLKNKTTSKERKQAILNLYKTLK